jgi:hypothetical protein
MSDHRFRLACYLLLGLLHTGVARSAYAKEVSVTAIPEQPTRLQAYYSWGPGCSFRTVTTNVSVQPAHGTLIPHTSMETIRTARFGEVGSCAGKQHKALQIDYKSDAGFHGTDSVTIDIVFGSKRHDVDHFSITVP